MSTEFFLVQNPCPCCGRGNQVSLGTHFRSFVYDLTGEFDDLDTLLQHVGGDYGPVVVKDAGERTYLPEEFFMLTLGYADHPPFKELLWKDWQGVEHETVPVPFQNQQCFWVSRVKK